PDRVRKGVPGSLVGRESWWFPFRLQGDGMRSVGTVLALVVLATVVAAFARRWRIPAPSLLVVAGLAVAMLPGTPQIEISSSIRPRAPGGQCPGVFQRNSASLARKPTTVRPAAANKAVHTHGSELLTAGRPAPTDDVKWARLMAVTLSRAVIQAPKCALDVP